MEILYVLTLILLGISFMIFRKSDEKLNFIKWIVIFIVSLLGYNVTIGMILGLLNITSHMWLLSLINIVFSVLLGYKAVKNKEFQKYEVRKMDIAGLLIVLAIFAVILIKDIRPQDGGIKYAAIDSAIHYRAAKHYADNLKIFVNVEDKTIFNFNVMQTGAYINDGLLMRVVNFFTGIDHEYIYEMFEILIFLLNALTFYVLIMDKVKNKFGFILTMGMMPLYMYGYPYSSYMYGFSYLSLGVVATIMLIIVVQLLFDKEKINKVLVITLISFVAMLLIFSYCLFVPGVFAAVCIYIFIKDFKENGKTFLKIFKKNTLIVTGILLLITALGIGYLVIPTFHIEGQSNLKDALLNDGGMYKSLYENFVFYLPFGILYIVDKIKNRKEIKEFKFEFLDVFAVVIIAYFAIMWLGMRLAIMSTYYFFKIYYIVWPVVVAITISLINKYSTHKIFGKILAVYESLFIILVIATVVLKASTLLPEDKKQKLPNYVGIYFSENCNYRGLIQAYSNLAKEQIEVMEYMKNIEDVNAENLVLITGSQYERCWATAISDLRSTTMVYHEITHDPTLYTIDDGMQDPEKKYIIRVNESYDLDEYEDKSGFDILFKNSRGYVLRKK